MTSLVQNLPALPTPTLLLLSLPSSALVGIDLLSFTSSPRFCGIKNLPPGWHFVFTGASASGSVRCGEWFHIQEHRDGKEKPELVIRKWDAKQEECLPVTDEEEVVKYRASLPRIWKEGLMPYRQTARPAPSASTPRKQTGKPFANSQIRDQSEMATGALYEENSPSWRALTSHITHPLISRLTSSSSSSSSTIPSTTNPASSTLIYTLTTTSSSPRDRDDIPGLTSTETSTLYGAEKELTFLNIDLRRPWPAGAIGRERTESYLDRSWKLASVIEDYETWRKSSRSMAAKKGNEEEEAAAAEAGQWGDCILGELQICFLATLTLANYSCLEQWKRLLGLVLGCRSLVRRREAFFVAFVSLLARQLRRCEDVEGGLFDMGQGGEANYLKGLLRGFKRGLDEMGADTDTDTEAEAEGAEEGVGDEVREEVVALEEWLRSEYGWDLGDGYLRRGMVELEDGERVELEMDGAVEEEEGEYAPVVVEL